MIFGVLRLGESRQGLRGHEGSRLTIEIDRDCYWTIRRDNWICVHAASNRAKIRQLLDDLTVDGAEQGPLIERIEAGQFCVST